MARRGRRAHLRRCRQNARAGASVRRTHLSSSDCKCSRRRRPRRGLKLTGGLRVLAYVLIAIGSALGGMGRYFVSGVVTTLTGGTFPYGTMIVNITGCLVIGFFATLTGPDGRLLVGTPARPFGMIGICAGDPSFSRFSLGTLYLMQAGPWVPAVEYARRARFPCPPP